MHRFFLPQQNIQSGQVSFPEPVSRQIVQVLRLKPDTLVTVLDGTGREYTVSLSILDAHHCEGIVKSEGLCANEPITELTLFLCMTQREKFEWILQKCTEVGVTRFVPVISSRSLVQDLKEVQSKYERWQRILQEAAEQSHRGKVPQLAEPMKFTQAVKEAQNYDCALIPWEDEHALSLKQALQKENLIKIALLIGPEGGFSREEVIQAEGSGFHAVTLGKRILRMETAAVVACSLVLYEKGEMN